MQQPFTIRTTLLLEDGRIQTNWSLTIPLNGISLDRPEFWVLSYALFSFALWLSVGFRLGGLQGELFWSDLTITFGSLFLLEDHVRRTDLRFTGRVHQIFIQNLLVFQRFQINCFAWHDFCRNTVPELLRSTTVLNSESESILYLFIVLFYTERIWSVCCSLILRRLIWPKLIIQSKVSLGFN